ncbi:DUF3466 family protein [bacterium]|nr:DUF3466 family protein [bacterium]
MRYLKRSAIALMVFHLYSFCTEANGATYQVLDLGVGRGGAINNKGEATGALGNIAFVYSNGTITSIGTIPGGTTSFGYSINDKGHVVGAATSPGNNIAAFYYDGTLHDLSNDLSSKLAGNQSITSVAKGINDNDEITGFFTTLAGSPQSFLINNGDYIEIPSIGGFGTSANAINTSGQVAGTSTPAPYSNSNFHPFLYDGQTHDLGLLPGATTSTGDAMNDAGYVVGQARVGSAFHAFVYDGSSMTDLGTLGSPFTDSRASGINNNGFIVGESWFQISGFGLQVAYVYDATNGMRSLNSLIDSSLGWNITSAADINDRGQIIGTGVLNGQTHAVILNPISVPEASALMLAAVFPSVFCLKQLFGRKFTRQLSG